MVDVIIKNGRVIDPSQDIDVIKDLYIKGDKIVEPPESNKSIENSQCNIIDATDCIVVPGLIDSHLHAFDSSSKHLNINADAYCLPNGVTTCIDGGSSGPYSFENFYRGNIAYSRTTIKALLHVSFFGINPGGWGEVSDPASFDIQEIKRLVHDYKDTIVGLKIRQHSEVARNLGVEPLKRVVEIANEIEEEGTKCSVTVHATDLPDSVEYRDIVKTLRSGDVMTHTYQNFGKTIINSQGEVHDYLWEAKEKGVKFDCGCATRLFALEVLIPAFKQGFYPDVIGSDSVGFNIYKKPLFSIPYIMSLFLNAGMSLNNIIEALTFTPSKLYAFGKNAGTLSTESIADISLLRIMDKEETYEDLYGGSIKGSKIFLPMATIKEGRIVFQQMLMI